MKKNIILRIADESDPEILKELNKISNTLYFCDYDSVHINFFRKKLIKRKYETGEKI